MYLEDVKMFSTVQECVSFGRGYCKKGFCAKVKTVKDYLLNTCVYAYIFEVDSEAKGYSQYDVVDCILPSDLAQDYEVLRNVGKNKDHKILSDFYLVIKNY